MPGAASGPLRAHHSRLEALWDLSLHDDNTPERQLRRLLQGALEALGCAYASLDHADDGILIAARRGDDASERTEHSLLTLASGREEPLMMFSTSEAPAWCRHPLVIGVPLGSALIWPFSGHRKAHALIFGWAKPRETFIANDEVEYIEFLAQIVVRLLDIAQRDRELSDRVVTDPLTGLYNRAATLDHIALAVAGAERHGVPVAVCYIDLDGFKNINDTYGHAFGDAALTETAHRMRGVLRKHEIAGRIGGDEFALLITAFHSESELARIARRVQQALGEPIDFGGTATSVRASIGIALFPADGKTPEELLMHADAAMYHAKRQRGAGYAFYGSSHPAPMQEAAGDQSRHAIEDDGMEREFVLCYQPIVDARTGKAIAAQALLRRLQPGAGLLAPGDFLEAARQQYGSVHIDRWVTAKAMRAIGQLQYTDRRLAMHITTAQAGEQFLSLLSDAPVNLCVEIPEDAVAEDPERYIAFAAACSERGIAVGLTNFGCGGLSLRYLSALSLEFVKIGISLVPATQNGPSAGRSVIETAHRFGWRAYAQQVESGSQQRWLCENGIDALQGYAVCSPLTDADFASWLRYKNSSAAKDRS